MEEEKRKAIALFRYGVISPLVIGEVEDKRPFAYFKTVKDKKYEYIDGNYVSVSADSINRWYKVYKAKGFDGLKPNGRTDVGQNRKLDEDVKNRITYYIGEFPRLPASQIYEKLKSDNMVVNASPSLSTVTRFVSSYKKGKDMVNITERRRYEKEHINEVWYGDTTYGPYIYDGDTKKRVYIIALIDDASRMIVACIAYFEDNFINLMNTIKSAVSKYGVPGLLSFDNGSNYRSNQMNLLGARIGVAINYCPPKTPQSKAKIERWFKTLKDQFLSTFKASDYHSLSEFNNDLTAYVQKYNTTIHSSLDNICPLDRFFKESHLIIRKNEEEIERDFLLEIERRVSSDSVVIINEKEYEVDFRYQGQKILIRYSPDLKRVYVADREEGKLNEIKLLDKHSNSNFKRKKIRLSDFEEAES